MLSQAHQNFKGILFEMGFSWIRKVDWRALKRTKKIIIIFNLFLCQAIISIFPWKLCPSLTEMTFQKILMETGPDTANTKDLTQIPIQFLYFQ